MLPPIKANRKRLVKTRISNLKLFFILLIGKESFPYEIRDKIWTTCTTCSLSPSPLSSFLVPFFTASLCLFPLIRSNSPSPRDKYFLTTLNILDFFLSLVLLKLPEFTMIPLNSLPQLLLIFKQAQSFLSSFRGINSSSCHLG